MDMGNMETAQKRIYRLFLAKEMLLYYLKNQDPRIINKILNLCSLGPVKWINQCVKDRFYF